MINFSSGVMVVIVPVFSTIPSANLQLCRIHAGSASSKLPQPVLGAITGVAVYYREGLDGIAQMGSTQYSTRGIACTALQHVLFVSELIMKQPSEANHQPGQFDRSAQ